MWQSGNDSFNGECFLVVLMFEMAASDPWDLADFVQIAHCQDLRCGYGSPRACLRACPRAWVQGKHDEKAQS